MMPEKNTEGNLPEEVVTEPEETRDQIEKRSLEQLTGGEGTPGFQELKNVFVRGSVESFINEVETRESARLILLLAPFLVAFLAGRDYVQAGYHIQLTAYQPYEANPWDISTGEGFRKLQQLDCLSHEGERMVELGEKTAGLSLVMGAVVAVFERIMTINLNRDQK